MLMKRTLKHSFVTIIVAITLSESIASKAIQTAPTQIRQEAASPSENYILLSTTLKKIKQKIDNDFAQCRKLLLPIFEKHYPIFNEHVESSKLVTYIESDLVVAFRDALCEQGANLLGNTQEALSACSIIRDLAPLESARAQFKELRDRFKTENFEVLSDEEDDTFEKSLYTALAESLHITLDEMEQLVAQVGEIQELVELKVAQMDGEKMVEGKETLPFTLQNKTDTRREVHIAEAKRPKSKNPNELKAPVAINEKAHVIVLEPHSEQTVHLLECEVMLVTVVNRENVVEEGKKITRTTSLTRCFAGPNKVDQMIGLMFTSPIIRPYDPWNFQNQWHDEQDKKNGYSLQALFAA